MPQNYFSILKILRSTLYINSKLFENVDDIVDSQNGKTWSWFQSSQTDNRSQKP